VTDPLYSVAGGQGHTVQSYGRCLLEKWDDDCDLNCMILASNMENVMIGRSLVSHSDQEEFLMKLHRLRSNDDTVNSFLAFITSKIPDVDRCCCRQFFQVWVRHFSTAVISCLTKLNSAAVSQSVDQPDILTTVEQNVLYYIAGYMVMKLKAATVRQPKLKKADNLVAILASKHPTTTDHFVKKYTEWVSVQSRGGLMYPSNEYYVMVRHLDRIFREMASGYDLHCDTFRSVVSLNMIENDLVKYYWGKIVEISNIEESIAMPVLEYLVSLFTAIKGHAWAQKQKSQVLADKGKVEKKRKSTKDSQSLRGKLK